MLAIYNREIRAYFTSPLGYVFIAVYFAVSGFVFTLTTLESGTTDAGTYFTTMLIFFIILIPLLTMKLLSEEIKLKTEQILLTSPVSITNIVLAKFFAAFTLFACCLVVSNLVNFSVLANLAGKQAAANFNIYNKISIPTIAGSTVGILLLGGAFIAIGLFLSSLTENQLVAAVSTIGALVGIFILNILPSYISSEALRVFVKWLSLFGRFSPFAMGIFDLTSIVYYISIVIIFLFFTVRVFEKRRWA